jgi:predicted transcriptional regulator
MARARTIKTRSKASLALAHCGKSTAELARVLELSDTMVDYLLSGERSGSAKLHKRVEERLDIPAAWWGQPAPKDSADVLGKLKRRTLMTQFGVTESDVKSYLDQWSGPRVAPSQIPADGDVIEPPVTTPGQIRDLAGEYTDRVRKFMRDVEADKLLSFPERSRILRECAISLDKAGKITGASSEIVVSKILKSPAWTKLGKIIADSILTHDDPKVAAAILRKVGEALKGAE